jgi:hypothetical protein
MASGRAPFDQVNHLLRLVNTAPEVEALADHATRAALAAAEEALAEQLASPLSLSWTNNRAWQDLIIDLSDAVGVQLRYDSRTISCWCLAQLPAAVGRSCGQQQNFSRKACRDTQNLHTRRHTHAGLA